MIEAILYRKKLVNTPKAMCGTLKIYNSILSNRCKKYDIHIINGGWSKYERDKYILDLCVTYPLLDEYYGLKSNKGYGTKKHLEGIKEYGISQWHRKSYGICKESKINIIR